MKTAWFITGASTGFGRCLAEELAREGHPVLATARRPEALDDLKAAFPELVSTARVDVTERETIRAALDTMERVDVVANNAGYGLMGAIEEASNEEMRVQYETNLFGALHVMQLSMERMRAQRSGRILNISSIVGITSAAGIGYYASTKHALEALSEALNGEGAPLGIRAVAIEPGPFRTDFHGRSLQMAAREIEDYAATSGERRTAVASLDGRQVGDPVRAARIMMEVAGMDDPPLRLLLGRPAFEGAIRAWESRIEEARRWEALSASADFPEEG
jgi:NAD(P)-dependent dehydrogenase (short-subunit alcohol dehydrogenase family)